MARAALIAGLTPVAPYAGSSRLPGLRSRFLDIADSLAVPMVFGGDEVHIWQATLDLPAAEIDKFRDTLAADELERAGRFHFARDQRRFIVARGTLRVVLSSYTATPPHNLRFGFGVHGKPFLTSPTSDLRFNLSHSEDTAFCAVTRGREVGVDLERIRTWPESASIVESLFTAGERTVFRATPADRRDETFFRWWTRKEAFIKALATGHAQPLDTVDVRHGLDSPDWMLYDLPAPPRFCAALVVGVATEGYGRPL